MKEIQDEILEWSTRNFGRPVEIKYDISSFLGMVEEMGEISHAILKMSQGIRGTREKHLEDIKDGIADLLVYLLDFCGRNELNAEQLLIDVWNTVKNRDWTKNKLDGISK